MLPMLKMLLMPVLPIPNAGMKLGQRGPEASAGAVGLGRARTAQPTGLGGHRRGPGQKPPAWLK